MLMEERRKYANAKAGDDVLFADFMEQWLEIVKSTVSIPTYSSYVNAVKSIIAPYFRKKKILYGICRHMTFKCFIRSNYSG